jgi:hypothetical protein
MQVGGNDPLWAFTLCSHWAICCRSEFQFLFACPSVDYDDLSAFGSSIVFSWPDYHSGTRFRGWLSLMKNLSYLILHCLKTSEISSSFRNSTNSGSTS